MATDRDGDDAMHPIPIPLQTPGYYLRSRPQGFAAHICASLPDLSAVRELARTELLAWGLAVGVIDDAQLVLSELVGSSVRASGTTFHSSWRCTQRRAASR